MTIVYCLVLYPLIKANYWLREHGLTKDEWFWADKVALNHGLWNHARNSVNC